MFTLFFNGIFRDWTICLARLSVYCCSVPNPFLTFFFFLCFMELELELAGIFPLIAGAMLGLCQQRAGGLQVCGQMVLVASILTLRRSRGVCSPESFCHPGGLFCRQDQTHQHPSRPCPIH